MTCPICFDALPEELFIKPLPVTDWRDLEVHKTDDGTICRRWCGHAFHSYCIKDMHDKPCPMCAQPAKRVFDGTMEEAIALRRKKRQDLLEKEKKLVLTILKNTITPNYIATEPYPYCLKIAVVDNYVEMVQVAVKFINEKGLFAEKYYQTADRILVVEFRLPTPPASMKRDFWDYLSIFGLV